MKFTAFQLTAGISSGFLSIRIARTRLLKEEQDCKEKTSLMNHAIDLLLLMQVMFVKQILLTSLLLSASVDTPFVDFSFIDILLESELENGSEFLRTNCFADVVDFTFPPNFQTPVPPVCFHSL